jgi:hypothetical protein
MAVAEDFLDGTLEAMEAFAAGVAFVAFHDRGPLMRGHGSGAGIGEQVDQNVGGGKKEQVVVSGFEQLFPFFAGGPVNAFDAEWFDDGFDGHDYGSSSPFRRRKLSRYAGQYRNAPGILGRRFSHPNGRPASLRNLFAWW